MERWSSRLVFVLAAIGSAVGIGNIWRFPMVVGQNGGGAYLIPYFLAVVGLAIPLMILEMAVGRHWRRNLVASFGRAGKRFEIVGWLICLIVLLILSYYLVIMGWTLAYLLFSLLGSTVTFSSFTSSLEPLAYFLISVLATGLIVSLGVNMGIERIVSIMIPFAFLILVALVLFCVSLPGFHPGMDFFIQPDYSMLRRPDVWSAAIGQAFFSLSVGMGILITYGAYLEDDMDIPHSALIITFSDLLAALLAGIGAGSNSSVITTRPERPATYFSDIKCSSRLKSASASATINGLISRINASVAVVIQPMWAYTPVIISWLRPLSLSICSSGER